MAKKETCENCGRDLPDSEWCEHCSHHTHKLHLSGRAYKRMNKEIEAERIERGADTTNDIEFRKHIELIISMSTDFLMNKLTKETYLANLKMITRKLSKP